jgi:hypothetical protein
MVSLVHMVAATGDSGVDWDSHWGNLTFEVPSRPAASGAVPVVRR